MAHIEPKDVQSPRRIWHLFEVISDGGPGGPAYALGTWDGERRIGFRWNGTKDNPIGNPQSRGLPTWIMLDDALHKAVVDMLSENTRVIAKRYLGLSE